MTIKQLVEFIEELHQDCVDSLIEAKEELGEPTENDAYVASIHSYIEGESAGIRKVLKYIKENNNENS
tara:strand:+ start:1475 stop:1678 length:204 start_codon:yes stop_codon:yes gene_type:complete